MVTLGLGLGLFELHRRPNPAVITHGFFPEEKPSKDFNPGPVLHFRGAEPQHSLKLLAGGTLHHLGGGGEIGYNTYNPVSLSNGKAQELGGYSPLTCRNSTNQRKFPGD